MNTPEIVAAIAQLQVKRKWTIKLNNKLMATTRALARRYCGFVWDVAETEREKVNKRAAGIVDRALKGWNPKEPQPDKVLTEQLPADLDIAEMMAPELVLLCQTLGLYEKRRDVIESEMKNLAKQLPVYFWAESVAGLGKIGLAVTVGEAGDLSRFPNVRHLWKRLGLAPFEKNGECRAMSQWHGNQLDAEEWIQAGYSGKRRAEIYACVGESLVKHQLLSKTKTESGLSEAKGPYGRVFVARRAHCAEVHPDWKNGHLNNDAKRVMTKAVLKDLWREWNHCEGIEMQIDRWAAE